MKILLSAYSCAPFLGSEMGAGWNWAVRLAARGHEVFVITRAAARERVEKSSPIPGLQFIYHDLPEPVPSIIKLNHSIGTWIYYQLWQYSAAKAAAAAHEKIVFDVVHHITWAAFRAPSFMGKLGIPFILGPVGGGEDTPAALRRGLGVKGRFSDFLRRVWNHCVRLDPRIRESYRLATKVFVNTVETLQFVPSAFHHKTEVHQSCGIDAGETEMLSKARSTNSIGPLKILYAGRLLHWKGLHLALKAVAKIENTAVKLTIVGSGPDKKRLTNLVETLRISERIEFIDWVQQPELMRMYSEFDVFLFPSLHDSGSNAVLEALRHGLPVICMDLGGPGLAVNSSCGRLITTKHQNEAQVVQQMAEAIIRLKNNVALREQLSKGAFARAEHLSWDASINHIYSRFEYSTVGQPLGQLNLHANERGA